MILQRIFGLIATTAFALGIVVQVDLLTATRSFDPFNPLLLVFAALVVIANGYATLRAERNQGLIDPYDDSIDIVEVAYSLPTWARVLSFMLACYIALLYVVVHYANGTELLTRLPEELSVLRQSIPANGFAALLTSLFTFSSFVIAIYLLFRKPIKEFH